MNPIDNMPPVPALHLTTGIAHGHMRVLVVLRTSSRTNSELSETLAAFGETLQAHNREREAWGRERQTWGGEREALRRTWNRCCWSGA